MSWSIISKEALDKIIPVRPPTVNRKIHPYDQSIGGAVDSLDPCKVASHLKTLIPVGTAIIIVTAVKYARVSTSIPTVNMWWAQTIKPRIPMPIIAKIMPKSPNGWSFAE